MENLTIVGFGIIGQIFAKDLKNFFNVTIWNRSDKSEIAKNIGVQFEMDMKKALEKADIILVCIPIPVFDNIIKKIVGFTKKDTLVIDVCSVKEKPMQIMKENLNCSFLGLHPLFGKVDSIKGYKIVACKGIGKDKGFLNVLKDAGAKIIEMDASEHDKILGSIQGMTHLIGLGVIEYIKDMDKKKVKSVSTPTFEYLLGLAERMQINNPEIFLEIQKHNKYARKARKLMLEKLKNVDSIMESD